MYSRNRVGVVVPVREKSDLVRDLIDGIPPYIDQIYIVSNGNSGEISAFFQPSNGNDRISLITSKYQPDGDLLLTPAFIRAIEDRMDVVAVVSGTDLQDTKYFPSLLDPIVWGRADLTKVRSPIAPAAGQKSVERKLPAVIPVAETKISVNYREMLEVLQKNMAVSRQVLEVIRDTPGTDSRKKVLLAIPCFNETLTIGSVILRAQHWVNEILVVNDGSTDDTVAVAQRAGAKVLSHPKNMGYGAALRSCFDYARQHDFDSLIILDGDGQHDPGDIPDFIEALNRGDADIVIGSRFLDGQSDIPFYRRIGMKVLDQVTSIASSRDISDSQCGYRAYGRKAIESIRIENMDMGAGSEILSQIRANNLRVREIPIQVRYDVPSASSQNPVAHGLEVLGNLATMIGYERPMLTFIFSGVIAVALGLVFGLSAFSISGSALPYGPSFISGTFLILGLLLISSGLILKTLVQILKTAEDRENHAQVTAMRTEHESEQT
ncbi:MAG TPA: glycosyltransferase family 2 protein [Methanomicrobiales archaeon]|nr:glycosyltransferase family 2 protein [Methanomicrobiales archaeon]